MGSSTAPGLFTFPLMAKNFVPDSVGVRERLLNHLLPRSLEYVGHTGHGFDIIYNGRPIPKAFFSWIGRRLYRIGPLPHDSIEQGQAFSADIPSAASVHDYVKGKIRTEDIVSQKSRLPCNFQFTLEQDSTALVRRTDKKKAFEAENA